MSVSVDAVASFVSARGNVEAGQAVAARIAEIDGLGQTAANLVQSLQGSRDSLAAAAVEIAAPPLDGTGSIVDRSV